MSYLIEPQGKRNLGYIPFRLAKQDLRFFGNPAINNFRGASSSSLFKHLVEVVDMNAKRICKIHGCFELNDLRNAFNGKLSFQQFNEQ